MERLYQDGADPLMVLQDLLDLSHFLTRLKLAPEAGIGDPISEGDRERARPLADKLAMPVLARAWQMLLKGLEEVQAAPSPIRAAEMILVRLAYVADLPAPAELVRSAIAPPVPADHRAGEALGAAERSLTNPLPPAARDGNATAGPVASAAPPAFAVPTESEAGALRPRAGTALRVMAELPDLQGEAARDPVPQDFAEILALFDKRREPLIRSHLWSDVHLVNCEPGRLEFRPAANAPRDLANRLGQLLSEWTGMRWLIAVSEAEGEPTLREQEEHRERDLRNEIAIHPLVQAVLETFPGATIAAVRERFGTMEGEAAEPPAGDPDDEAGMGEDET
jgi:DNA polymerase-3 subunit gamma/tau